MGVVVSGDSNVTVLDRDRREPARVNKDVEGILDFRVFGMSGENNGAIKRDEQLEQTQLATEST